MKHFAVLAIGRDKSGIVAWITSAIHEAGGSIATSQMAMLGDHFSMMLVVAAETVGREDLLVLLEDTASQHGEYKVLVTDVAEYDSHARAEASHLVTVYCKERSGVISAISKELSRHDVNITHLHSLVQPGPDRQEWCVTRAYVTMPHELRDEQLREALAAVLNDAGASIRLEQLKDPQSWG